MQKLDKGNSHCYRTRVIRPQEGKLKALHLEQAIIKTKAIASYNLPQNRQTHNSLAEAKRAPPTTPLPRHVIKIIHESSGYRIMTHYKKLRS